MSKKHNAQTHLSDKGMTRIPSDSKVPTTTPKNCTTPCCYGAGRDFCFPCYGQIVKEYREKKG
ncbi:MAG: hypothetical protein HUJ70_09775 [Pseudobutyrivibrio sp.]|nr:hypothetical protein [Pseudobutyrivibrio sp.]